MKVIIVALALLLIAPISWAMLDYEDNSNTNQQGQAQGISSDIDSKNTNMNTNITNSDADARSSAGAAAIQGQIGIVGQANKQTVEGDDITTYVMTAPDTVAQEGQSAASVYSIFGGINVAESAEYHVCIEKIVIISQMQAAGLLTKEGAIIEANEAFEQLKDASRPKRILSVGPKTRGRHIFNLFGLIATDAAY